MNKFMELHDSYELYEFARQYYLDIEKIDMKKMKFPVGVYFDEETGKPTFESVNPEEPTYKIKFINNGDVSLFAANTIEEIIKAEEKVTKKVTIKVTINQQKIIDVIKKNPYLTQEELADIIGITKKSVTVNMKKLQKNGLIKRIGANKNGYWQVNE